MPSYTRPVLVSGYQVSWPATVNSVNTYGGPRVRRDFTNARPIANLQWSVPLVELESDLAFFEANIAVDITMPLIVDDCDIENHLVRITPDSLAVREYDGDHVTIAAECVITPLAANVDLDLSLVGLFNDYLDEKVVIDIIFTIESVINDQLMAGL